MTYKQYFLAGIAATGIMLASFQALGIRIALERDEGELARLQALGTPAVSYFLGKAAQVVVTAALQMVALLLVARFAFDVPMPVDAATGSPSRGSPCSARSPAPCWASRYRCPRARPVGGHQGRAAIALVLQFFSGVFFVFSTLPAWMRDVAAVFPLKWLTQGMRSAFLPDPAKHAEVSGSWQHGTTALVLLAWIVARRAGLRPGLPLAASGLSRDLHAAGAAVDRRHAPVAVAARGHGRRRRPASG